MEYYTSEQEQVEQIKRWWKSNGTPLLLGLVLGFGGLGGYRYWDSMQIARAEDASTNYGRFLEMLNQQSLEDARKTGESIIANYPASSYAGLSALLLAKMAVDRGDYPDAKKHLETVLASSGDPELKHLARSRLARLLLAEGEVSSAAAMLEQIPDNADGAKRFLELRADVLAAQGEYDAARLLYLSALSQADAMGSDRETIQLKLDNLTAGDS